MRKMANKKPITPPAITAEAETDFEDRISDCSSDTEEKYKFPGEFRLRLLGFCLPFLKKTCADGELES